MLDGFGWGVEIGRYEGTSGVGEVFFEHQGRSQLKKQKGGFCYWQKQGSKEGSLSLKTE